MLDEIIDKIVEETGESEEDIRKEIENKEKEFQGLVSEEGAAHLIAKEKGVDIAKKVDKELKVESIVPGMSSVNLKAKIVDITDINTFTRDDGDDGKVRNLVLGDETGTLRMSLWDEQTDVADKLDKGDVIEISNAYSKEDNRGNSELRIGNSTKIKRLDKDDIGEVKTSGGRSSYKKTRVNMLMNENEYREVSGEIVQIYTKSPFYRRCPECDGALRKENDYECEEHGEVSAVYKIALPVILDDGFGNIRCIVFNDTAKKLLGAENIEFDGDVEKLKKYAEEALGKRVSVKGKTQYNDFFNSLEIVVNEVSLPETKEIIESKLEAIKSE